MRVLGRAAVLVALGAAALAPRARAQSVVVGPLPSSTSAIPGTTITLPVVADLTSSGGASLGSATLRLTWHPGILTYLAAGPGALGSPTVNLDSAGGALRVALANPGGASGMPVLFSVTFAVTGAAADTTILGLTVDEITAAGTFADLKPFTATTRTSFCTSTGLWGDVDGDDAFTGHDALIMLTNGVGLPIEPYSVVNGDVDASGAVDSRDALIVLSAAVDLPVAQFRIGHINSGLCSLRTAAAVQIQPRTPTVAPGDSLPVTAVVTDSTGALVQGVGLVWQSKDLTLMRPGGSGSLVAVAPGSTYALVYVQPGVKDSVPVTVTPVRHQWYVNPAVAAANLGVELGSQLYPFASIDTAMMRAAPTDTVHVAVADYGPVRITKPLTLLGDSSAGGFPRLSSGTADPTAPALRVDTVAGLVTVRGLRLVNSRAGMVTNLVQTLVLGSVSVEGVHGPGVRVFGTDSAAFSHVSVVGAVGNGIELDSVRAAVLDHVRSDALVGAQQGGSAPLALKVAQTMALSGDSIALGTAGAFVDSALAVALRRLRVANPAGQALVVNATTIAIAGSDFSGAAPGGGPATTYTVALNAGGALEGPPQGSIRLDSSRVHDNGLWGVALYGGATVSMRADTVARNYAAAEDESSSISDFGRLSLAQTAFIGGGPGYVDIEGTGVDTVTADSVVLDANQLYAYNVAAFLMHGGVVRNGVYLPTLSLDAVPIVELDSIEASANHANESYGPNPAVGISYADTVTVNGINAHDNWPAALEVQYAAVLRLNGGTMLNNGGPYTGQQRATLSAYQVADTRVYGLTLRDAADVGLFVTPNGGSRTVVDSSFLEGSATLIRDLRYCCTIYGDTLIVSRSALTGFAGTSDTGVDAEYLAQVAVVGSLLDSLSDAPVLTLADTTIVSQNAIRAWGGAGVESDYSGGALAVDSNAFAACTPGGMAILAGSPGTTSVSGNTMTGCGSLLYLYGPYDAAGPNVQVLGDTVQSDSSAVAAILLQGSLGFVQVAGNLIRGGTAGGILLGLPYYNTEGDLYSADTARVDSNTVQQTRGDGIRVNNVMKGLSARYNLASDNQGYGMFSYVPFVAAYNTVVRNVNGVGDSTTYMSFFRNANIVGNTQWGAATFFSTLWADSSWWNDPLGPSCVEICKSGSTGDSISGGYVEAVPVDSIGPVAGAPPIPSPPGAPPLRRLVATRAAAAPRPPKTTVVRLPHAGVPAAAAGLAAPQRAAPVVPRRARPTGRVIGHHRPAWQTGVPQ